MAKLEFATIDYETYYDRDFSLSKLQTDAYVLDPRFEIIGVSVKANSASDPVWCSDDEAHVKQFLQDSFDWSKTPVCCQNTNFDGFISTQRLGLKPQMWMDTLGMVRMLYPWWKRYGLARIAENLEFGQKGHQVQNYMGYTRADFSPAELRDYGDYCDNDVELTHAIAEFLLPRVPWLELLLIDMEVRQFTEPHFELDRERLIKYHQSEVERKQQLIDNCKADKKTLMSNNKFAEMLGELSIIPPTKISPRTGKTTYAFAKSDKQFTALLEHPDEDVQALVAARLGVKSTIAETRALRFVQTASRGKLPVYIHHWGAKTTGRQSAGNKMNMLNIPARGPAAELRYSMRAPEGHKVVVGDSSNIELRKAMTSAGQSDAVQRLWDGIDEYCVFASKLYGREITKEDTKERDLGKVAMLSLQYQTGMDTFRNMARLRGVVLSPSEAEHIVHLYRRTYNKVKDMWNYCQNDVLRAIYNKQYLTPVDVNGWFLTNPEGFSLPGTPGVCYHDLYHSGDDGWLYKSGGADVKIYGGKVFENLCQHGARQIVMWQTGMVHRRFPVALSVYDEIVCVVPDRDVDECVALMERALSQTPQWCRDQIPLEGEVKFGQTYGDAK